MKKTQQTIAQDIIILVMVLPNIPGTRDNITSYFTSFLKNSWSETKAAFWLSLLLPFVYIHMPHRTKSLFTYAAVKFIWMPFRKKSKDWYNLVSNNEYSGLPE